MRQSQFKLRQAAFRQKRVVAVDLGQERFLRGYREDLRRRDREQLCAGAHLPSDLGFDFRGRPQLVPQSVDLVQDDIDVGLGHAGIRGEDEQHRVCVGEKVERQFGLGSNRVKARRVENHQTLLQKRVREIDHRVAPARNVDGSLVGRRHRGQHVALIVKAVFARQHDRHAFGLRDLRQDFAHPVRR